MRHLGHWYLSVRGCGRHRLPREGRSKVSGFLSVRQAWMFRYLNMWTFPLRHIWNTNEQQISGRFWILRQRCILLATRWCCCAMLEGEERRTNMKSTLTCWRSPKSITEPLILDICSYWTSAHTYYSHELNLWGQWTCLSGWWLHRIIVEDDVLQLPELPVGCGNLCDLIAGEVESDERQVSQLCKQGWQHVKNDS